MTTEKQYWKPEDLPEVLIRMIEPKMQGTLRSFFVAYYTQREELALCNCWNREMGGRAGADSNTCKDFAEYLKSCGLEWCPPCRAKEQDNI